MSDRRRAHLLPGALAAIAALGLAAAPVQSTTAPGVTLSPTKEYVAPTRQQRQKKKKQNISGGGKGRGGWQWDRQGNAIDGVGNFRSSKRLRRQLLLNLAGVPKTGRQWNRLRKTLRRQAPHILVTHPRTLKLAGVRA